MKLRLRIAVSRQPPRAFDHAGPAIRIGRDPAGELVFQEPDIDTVSWNHARIDLTPQGATLHDLGSTNGTFVNAKRLTAAAPLQPGDEIRLGQTGPALEVCDIDVALPTPPSRPAPAAVPLRIPPMALLAASGLIGLILIIAAIAWWKSGPSEQPRVQGPTVAEPPPTVPGRQPMPTGNEVKPPVIPPIIPPLPSPEFLGRYIRPPKAPRSVLLERQRNDSTWGRLRTDHRVQGDQYLMSLPGYRSMVQLESGVRLTLWGNVPAFSYPPPVLESVVVLQAPQNADLDFTLDRGRVHLANGKERGEARIRVRFRNETWELTLPDAHSEAVLQLWGTAAGTTDGGPLNVVDLFVKGPAQLKARDQTWALQDKSQVTWTSVSPKLLGPRTLPLLPPWWTSAPDVKDPLVGDLVAETILVLTDFDRVITDADPVLGSVLSEMRDHDAGVRSVGVLFLAALDALPQVVDALEDGKSEAVRLAAWMALQVWISRGLDHQRELARVLFEQKGFARDRVQVILPLLQGVPDDQTKRPETYATLIDYLNHKDQVVRNLAWWHLSYLAPEEAAGVKYDPAAPPETRESAIVELKKRIPAGQVPRRVSQPPK